MRKKKIKNNLKISKLISENIFEGTKNKIRNFYQNLKKESEKRKLRIEKEKKIQEKKRNPTTKEASSKRKNK